MVNNWGRMRSFHAPIKCNEITIRVFSEVEVEGRTRVVYLDYWVTVTLIATGVVGVPYLINLPVIQCMEKKFQFEKRMFFW